MVTENSNSAHGPKIAGRYTLLMHIPVYVFDDGSIRTVPLWEKDLSLHFEYIEDLHLACPVLGQSDAGDMKLATIGALDQDHVHHVAENIGWGGAARNLIPHFLAMGKVARESDIVHGGAAGWPFPLSFYLLFWRHFYRFKWIQVVESSFWRLEPGEAGSLRKRIAHMFHMWLVPKTLKRADARIFTQNEYRRSLLGETSNTLVSPAVWYDNEHLETSDGLTRRHAARSAGPARVLFPTRMTADKGVETVMEAVGELEQRLSGEEHLVLDWIGEGDMAGAARAFARQHSGRVEMRFLDPVPYGVPFFELMRGYDAIIVANRKAEQPRIIFDAFSQGVPPIATRTTGVLDCVRPGTDAETFAIDDAGQLAGILADLARDPLPIRRLGEAALAKACEFTHLEMHRKRHAFLLEVL